MSKDKTIKQILDNLTPIESFSREDLLSFLTDILLDERVVIDLDFDKVQEWVKSLGDKTPTKIFRGHTMSIELFIPKEVMKDVKKRTDNTKS